MLLELERVKWDLIGISASQIKETYEEVLPEGHYLFNSGNDESRTNGVGFLVHKSISPFILAYKPISDRLAILSLQGRDNKFVFIQAYFPTSTHTDEEVEELYD